MLSLTKIRRLVKGKGMIYLGGFYPTREDLVANIKINTKTIILIGNAGPEMWQEFINSRSQDYSVGQRYIDENPLDSWTKKTVDKLAKESISNFKIPQGPGSYFGFPRVIDALEYKRGISK